MAYEKLTMKAFKEALQANKYESVTAARRAVGKASAMSDQEKESCRSLLGAHFGGTAPAAKSQKKEPEQDNKQKPQTPAIGGSLDDITNLTVQMRIAEKTIQNTGTALGTLLEAKKVAPDSDLTENIEAASAVLSNAVEIFRGVTEKVTSYMNSAAKQPEQRSCKSNGKAVFEETAP